MDFDELKKQYGEDAVEEAFMLGVVQGLKQAHEWRPIETAPEFKEVLVVVERTGHIYLAERQGNRWWRDFEFEDIRVYPIKWMPLPPKE